MESAGVADYLPNPRVDLYRMGTTAELVESSSLWDDNDNSVDITATDFAPSDNLEASLVVELLSGVYTAIVSSEAVLDAGDERVALVEVYEVGE